MDMPSQTKLRIAALALGWSLVMVSSTTAWAQEGDAHQEMLRLSAEAQEQYDAGQLQEAADTYREAYAAYPQPILLKNEMIARYLIEDCDRSMELAQGFEASGEATAEDELDLAAVYADCSLVLASASLEAGELEEARQQLTLGESHWDEELAGEGEALWERLGRAQTEREAQAQSLAASSAASSAIEAPPEVGGAPVGGWVLTAGGVVGIVGASAWYLSSRGDVEELQEVAAEGIDRARYEELSDSVATARWGVPTLYALSGLATVGGILWVVMQSSDEAPALTVMPEVGPQSAGARLRLRF
ncbi:hypothetical protein EA187_12115 [Lujinxingia sediminis]|uniref:Tetratricopeptide repeat protein n=2 Tax=Lujinxingia sediminis TaxID=2480984 RepID=A0ABY0CST3_9DELT|nr:hypothetical protein EA187_12115 [Lujinxingia sediminis]